MSAPILQAEGLARHYLISQGMFNSPATVKALDGADFTMVQGKTLAVVGESGCGKSTLARLVTMIEEPTAGRLMIDGADVLEASAETKTELRRTVQIVFQDPYSSLNPRQKVGSILEEPLKINTSMSAPERREAAIAMMQKVGLRPEHYPRYPHMFSGGQRQRIAVARALMLNPRIVILDEPVSALDVSIQAQVLNLLADLQDEFDLAYLFISHDLSVVRHVADEIMVMYLGHPVEKGSRDEIFNNPRHPYTRALLSATPKADPLAPKERIKLVGELPSPMDPPSGCPFHPRCPSVGDKCASLWPEVETVSPGHETACHHWKNI
jgi:dipeptide transport system ATP-binding protein